MKIYEISIEVEITEPDEITATNNESIAIVSEYNGYNISCFGANDGYIELEVSGGVGEYSFEWTGPNGFSSTEQNIENLDQVSTL